MNRETLVGIIALIILIAAGLYLWSTRAPIYTWRDPISAPTTTMPTPLPVPER